MITLPSEIATSAGMFVFAIVQALISAACMHRAPLLHCPAPRDGNGVRRKTGPADRRHGAHRSLEYDHVRAEPGKTRGSAG